MLEALRFMSINERIEYNVCLLIFKMINVHHVCVIRLIWFSMKEH